jgi:hypothetical protein
MLNISNESTRKAARNTENKDCNSKISILKELLCVQEKIEIELNAEVKKLKKELSLHKSVLEKWAPLMLEYEKSDRKSESKHPNRRKIKSLSPNRQSFNSLNESIEKQHPPWLPTSSKYQIPDYDTFLKEHSNSTYGRSPLASPKSENKLHQRVSSANSNSYSPVKLRSKSAINSPSKVQFSDKKSALSYSYPLYESPSRLNRKLSPSRKSTESYLVDGKSPKAIKCSTHNSKPSGRVKSRVKKGKSPAAMELDIEVNKILEELMKSR